MPPCSATGVSSLLDFHLDSLFVFVRFAFVGVLSGFSKHVDSFLITSVRKFLVVV